MDIEMQGNMIRESLGKSWDEVRDNLSGYGVCLEESDMEILVSIIISPKREEHVHLDGSINFELLQSLWFSGSKDNLRSKGGGWLVAYLRPFQEIGQWMQTEENLFAIAKQFVLDQHKEGIIQTEVRYDPHLHTFGGLSIDRVMESVFLWLREGALSLDGKIWVKAILWVNRWLSAQEVRSISDDMLDFLGNHPEWWTWVGGFDLNCAESGNPPSKHRETLSDWKNRGYPLIIHAGEELSEDSTDTSAYVREAVELGVERIGHAILCQNDPEVLRSIREANIGVEICVSSNWQTGANKNPYGHPLSRYLEQWLRVSINTDNKTVGGMTLCEEILLIHKKLWIGLGELLKASRWYPGC